MNCLDVLEEEGHLSLEQVFARKEVAELLQRVTCALESGSDGNIKTSLGETYAARNLIDLAPELILCWQQPRLLSLLHGVLGPDVGLVRILYFDKHPKRTWALPWHQDMTIAVRDNSLPSSVFHKPTTKSGVPHVEAPTSLLQRMLTLRIHLDDVTSENGPLKVVRGSHTNGKISQSATAQAAASAEHHIDTVFATAGDVLAMRPLISHSSGASEPGTEGHRRILHLEFSGQRELPDGFKWHRFVPMPLGESSDMTR